MQSGAQLGYRHPDGRRRTVHRHPGKTYRDFEKLLNGMLTDIGWTVDDLKRLKLIKKC